MAGVISNNDALYEEIHKAGITAGEFNWRLPMTKELDEKLKVHLEILKTLFLVVQERLLQEYS